MSGSCDVRQTDGRCRHGSHRFVKLQEIRSRHGICGSCRNVGSPAKRSEWFCNPVSRGRYSGDRDYWRQQGMRYTQPHLYKNSNNKNTQTHPHIHTLIVTHTQKCTLKKQWTHTHRKHTHTPTFTHTRQSLSLSHFKHKFVKLETFQHFSVFLYFTLNILHFLDFESFKLWLFFKISFFFRWSLMRLT